MTELVRRFESLKKDVINYLKNNVDHKKELFLSTKDPYGEMATVRIYKLDKEGILCDKYEEPIPYEIWDLDALIAVIKEGH